MFTYGELALGVDILHLIVCVFWGGGFFVPRSQFPRFRIFHSNFGISVFLLQLAVGMNCPLTLLSAYLRKMDGSWRSDYAYESSFTIDLLRKVFGLEVPEIVVTLTIAIGFVAAVVTLKTLKETGKISRSAGSA
jgi:hypothetical protein